MNGKRSKAVPMLASLAAGVAFGSSGTVSQIVIRQGFSVGDATVSQFLIATVVMGVLVAVRYRDFPPARDVVKLLLIGLLQPVSVMCLYCGIDNLSVGQAVAIQFQYVWLTVVIQSVADKKLPGIWAVVSSIVIIAGTMFTIVIIAGTMFASGVVDDALSGGSALNAVGVAFSVVCAVSYSFFLYLNGRTAVDVHPVTRTFILLVSGTVLSSVVNFGFYENFAENIIAIAPGATVLCLLLIAPVFCLSYVSKRLPGSVVAILTSVELPAAVATGALVLGDQTSALKIFGVVVIIMGIALSQFEGKPKSS